MNHLESDSNGNSYMWKKFLLFFLNGEMTCGKMNYVEIVTCEKLVRWNQVA